LLELVRSATSIHDWAFSSSWGLEDVGLNEGLIEIGEFAFVGCALLERIKIPSSVNILGKAAFMECEKLVNVEFCEGLVEIERAAFYGCYCLTSISIPSTVKVINERVFKFCKKLEKVELCEGLVEIGEDAFYGCKSIKSVNIPSTVKTIGSLAFCYAPLQNLTLPDSIESIGDYAFCNGAYSTVRIPPLITTITGSMCRCRGMVSMEIPTSIEKIDDKAFNSNTMLRNLALPSNAKIGNDVFKDCKDLKRIGTERKITKALKHRFDRLPIHKMLYYQSYDQSITGNNFDDPSIKQQDTLGMTPLHILACSTKQNIDLYKILIERHPESLITQDKWGALPLLYAVWSKASNSIVELLVQSYKSIFPNYVFNWTKMMETLATISATETETKCLHNIQKESFSNQRIDLDTLVEKAITRSNPDHSNYITHRSLQCLTVRLVSTRALAIRNKALQQQVIKCLCTKITTDTTQGRRDYVNNVHKELEICEDKYNRWMEAFTMIEFVLWKNKMDDCCGQQKKTRLSKKMRLNDTDMRKQCRLKCGAETNIVIEHVSLYLDKL